MPEKDASGSDKTPSRCHVKRSPSVLFLGSRIRAALREARASSTPSLSCVITAAPRSRRTLGQPLSCDTTLCKWRSSQFVLRCPIHASLEEDLSELHASVSQHHLVQWNPPNFVLCCCICAPASRKNLGGIQSDERECSAMMNLDERLGIFVKTRYSSTESLARHGNSAVGSSDQ